MSDAAPLMWDSASLMGKAQVYFARAYREDRGSSLFGTWIGLGVEHLARCALATIHPVLLADPREGNNILFAFGVEMKSPRSVPMRTVLSRCNALFDDFTDTHEQALMALTELQNTELHSGIVSFESIPAAAWYLPTMRAVVALCAYTGLGLDDLIGEEEAALTNQMLAEASKERTAEVLALIAEHRAFALSLDAQDRERREVERIRRIAPSNQLSYTRCTCPACEASAELAGSLVRELPPVLNEDSITERSLYLPVRMLCPVCELDLKGHERLQIAGVGEVFVETCITDADDYFSARFAEREYEPDYGND